MMENKTEEIVIGEFIIIPDKLKARIEAKDSESYKEFLLKGLVDIKDIRFQGEGTYLVLGYSPELVKFVWSDMIPELHGRLVIYLTDISGNRLIGYIKSKFYVNPKFILKEITPSGEIIVKII